MSEQDPRRNLPLQVSWDGGMMHPIGRITIDGELWASVEWSEKRQAWCIEDAEGACLRHTDHIRGQEASKEAALALAKAMIADGRMPTPEEARAQREAAAAQRAEQRRAAHDKPANVRARQRRKEQQDRRVELFRARLATESRDNVEAPLWECLADAFDFGDPELWRSNSFGSLRPRLVIWMQSVVAKLEEDINHAAKRYKPWHGRPEPAAAPKQRVARLAPKLAKAREILGWLEGEPHVQSEAAE